jgi:hypothetical protein
MRKSYKILDEKPEGKSPLGRTRSRWENNIIMDLWQTGLKYVDWMNLDLDREQRQAVENTVMSLWIT